MLRKTHSYFHEEMTKYVVGCNNGFTTAITLIGSN